MKNARILIAFAFSAFIKQGGGEAEAVALRTSLASQNIEVEFYGPNASALESYDVVIFFSCHTSGLELLFSCIELGIKFIFWPNFWIENSRELTSSEIETVNKYCELSDKIALKSNTETKLFQKHFALDEEKIIRVNWFIAPELYPPADPQNFKELYGLDTFLLSVGLLEPIKNQMRLIDVVRLTGKHLVLIGGFRKRSYYEECMRAADGHVVFIPNLPIYSPILASAYAGCEAYIEISSDPPGRSALEAAWFNKPLILADSDWAKEIFQNAALLVNPNNVEEIQQALNRCNNAVRLSEEWKRNNLSDHLSGSALNKLYQYMRELERH